MPVCAKQLNSGVFGKCNFSGSAGGGGSGGGGVRKIFTKFRQGGALNFGLRSMKPTRNIATSPGSDGSQS